MYLFEIFLFFNNIILNFAYCFTKFTSVPWKKYYCRVIKKIWFECRTRRDVSTFFNIPRPIGQRNRNVLQNTLKARRNQNLITKYFLKCRKRHSGWFWHGHVHMFINENFRPCIFFNVCRSIQHYSSLNWLPVNWLARQLDSNRWSRFTRTVRKNYLSASIRRLTGSFRTIR